MRHPVTVGAIQVGLKIVSLAYQLLGLDDIECHESLGGGGVADLAAGLLGKRQTPEQHDGRGPDAWVAHGTVLLSSKERIKNRPANGTSTTIIELMSGS
jgi:hypothetical protein